MNCLVVGCAQPQTLKLFFCNDVYAKKLFARFRSDDLTSIPTKLYLAGYTIHMR